MKYIPYLILVSILGLMSTNQNTDNTIYPNKKHHSFDKYWYDGKAEISSYKLKQGRYGEIHRGTASLIFVTEPFSPQRFVKPYQENKQSISVLKLNFVKKFNTGIYPYSMMTSTFLPIDSTYSLKVSSSSQEWCGHTYMELKNKKKFEVDINSYFEGESQKNIQLDKALLEDDFWSKIRINPHKLPKGNQNIIPSFFFLRLKHQELRTYTCIISHIEKDNTTSTYAMYYPELKRNLRIDYETEFPHKILAWEESYTSGFGSKRQKLTTSAKLIKSIKVDYWNKNSTKDSKLRKNLKLD